MKKSGSNRNERGCVRKGSEKGVKKGSEKDVNGTAAVWKPKRRGSLSMNHTLARTTMQTTGRDWDKEICVMVTKRYLEKKWLKPAQERWRREEFERLSQAAREQFTQLELDKIRHEAHENGRQQDIKESYKAAYGEGFRGGYKEGRQAWIDWNNRRSEAKASGLPFDEPPLNS